MGALGLGIRKLGEVWAAWGFAALLPLPVLLALSPAVSFQIACLYLGIANGWLAAEIFQSGGLPETLASWRAKMVAVWVGVGANVALFILLGISVGVHSNMPFPMIAALSGAPALGLVPWLIVRVRNPYMTIILGAMIVSSVKLAACVVARFVYGPNYMEQGYVAADWRTAKLMLTLFWIGHPLLSLGLCVFESRRMSVTDNG